MDTPATEATGDDVIVTLRTAQQHQVNLSIIADQKANIVIGFALIFFSVVQSQIFAKEFTEKVYFLPLTALSLTVFFSLFLAILVVLPRTAKVNLNVPADMPNPLFFGFFSSFSQEEYTDYMLSSLDSNERARKLLIQDIYQIGAVLKRKYQLLRMSYMALAFGALLSIVILVLKLIMS